MSSLESALRSALKKGDLADPLFRRKVYEAAAGAMHRALEAKGNAPKQAFDQQKLRLAEAIRVIEADIKSATEASTTPKSVNTEPPSTPKQSVQENPVVNPVSPEPVFDSTANPPEVSPEPVTSETGRTGRLYVEPSLDSEPLPKPVKPKPGKSTEKRRAPFAKFLAGSVAIALLGIGLFWVITTGAFQSAEQRDTSVPNPERVLQSESFEGRDPGTSNAPETLDTRAGDASGWVTLFSPSDPTTLGLIGGATASVESDPFGDFVRLTTPSADAEVQIDVPLSIMSQASGQTVQVSLLARSDEGQPTQMSVTCDFATLGDCGRVRFNVGQAENEYLFQVSFSEQSSSSASGLLKISTDIENNGGAIKLLEARARLVEN